MLLQGGSDVSEDVRNIRLWLSGLTIIALVLRLVNLDSGLWIDEIYSLVNQYRLPVATLFTRYVSDNQHPLYAVLASASVSVFGEHAWSIRLPAVLFGVASVPALYLLGAEVSNRREGLLAAAFLTFSYHHVWFSQNARGYTALSLAAILSCFYFIRLWRKPNPRDVWLYGMIAALGCYAHLTLVFILIGQFLVYLLAMLFPGGPRHGPCHWKPPLVAFVLAGAMTLLLYSPIIGQVADYFLHQPSDFQSLATPVWALAEAIRSLSLGFGAGLVVVIAALFAAAGLISYFRSDPVALALFTFPILVTISGALIARGTMYPRFFFALIGFAILIGVRGVMATFEWGARRLLRGEDRATKPAAVATGAMVLAILVSAFSLGRNYQYPKMDFQGALRWVEAHAGQQDRIMTIGAAAWPYQTYYGVDWPMVKAAADLHPMLAGEGSVWVVYTLGRNLEKSQPDLMAVIHKNCIDKKRFRGTLGNGDIIVCQMLKTD